MAKPGLVRAALPLDTIDRAAPDLRDLRVVGENREEIPFTLIRPTASAAHWQPAENFTVSLASGSTEITVRSGGDGPWESIQLETSTPRFMKAARLESSRDGEHWETWGSGLPLFRQDGAELTAVPLRREAAPWLRVTLEDTTPNRLVINGVRLRTLDQRDATFATLPVEVQQNEVSATESVLTLRLPAAHLDLERLEIDSTDELFTRAAKLGVREVQGDTIVERIISTDTIYRVALEGAARSEKNALAVNSTVPLPTRELILHIENGDSRPLKIRGVRAVQRRAYVAFDAGSAGQFSLWSGNPQANAPRYDLVGLTSQLRHVAEANLDFAPAQSNPLYRQADPLAGLALEGSAIDAAKWRTHRGVVIQTGGVQTLELDLAALSSLDPLLRDLRLVRAGKQIPFIIERTNTLRSLEVPIVAENRADHPRESQWKLRLPYSHLPIAQLSLQTSNSVFDRHLEISEERDSANGSKFQMPLGVVRWQRNLNEPNDTVVFPIESPRTAVLTIRTENGDNPPITLEHAKINYPITRVLFRAEAGGEPITLLSGNDSASAPHYDIALVAEALLQSEKQTATLAAQVSEQKPSSIGIGTKSVLLWTTLALVVAGLLFVVAKLLPATPEK